MPDEGDDWLRFGGFKFLIDGSYEGAWMKEPYAEPFGKGGTYYGIQLIPSDIFIAMVRELGRRGHRVAVHTLGDAALDLVLGAFEAADRDKSIASRRWVIEHGFLSPSAEIPRIKRLGIQIGTQRQLYFAAPSMKKFWGEQRAKSVNQLRTLLDNKVGVAGGTDLNGQLFPTFYHYITRQTISDGVYAPEQRISRQEALRLFTINNAYLTFEENVKGSLEPGKLADLVVLSDDIMTCPVDKILDLTVLMTMVNGKIVFQHKEFQP